MRYAVSKYNLYSRETAYRIYVSDMQRITAAYTALAVEVNLTDLPTLNEFMHPKKKDTRTGVEILQYVVENSGFTIV